MFNLSKFIILGSIVAAPALALADTTICTEVNGGPAKVQIDSAANTIKVDGLGAPTKTYVIKSKENTFTDTVTYIGYNAEVDQSVEIAVETTGRTSTLEAEGTSAYLTCQVPLGL